VLFAGIAKAQMIRILLLDCSESIEQSLKAQGFDVEAGTVGFCTGVRKLPSQVYEKEIFIYNPTSIATYDAGDVSIYVDEGDIEDSTPEYSLSHLGSRIKAGATMLVFVNRLSKHIEAQKRPYSWIPFMPSMQFTSDKTIYTNRFDEHPHWKQKAFLPIVTTQDLDLPVLQKIQPPQPQPYTDDVFPLFWNGNRETLGVLILRGSGRLIVLPKFLSNDSVIETFLHRVVPSIHDTQTRIGLVEMFRSPEQLKCIEDLGGLTQAAKEIAVREEAARIRLATATREKSNIIKADETAKQIITYHTEARRQPEVALFYLYKIIESVEHRFGGEAAGMAAVGEATAWKSVKRLANESYRDARHAPKPSDIIKKWSEAEIKKCFVDTEKVIVAYFATLFASLPPGGKPTP
jgi:hypothetical protein